MGSYTSNLVYVFYLSLVYFSTVLKSTLSPTAKKRSRILNSIRVCLALVYQVGNKPQTDILVSFQTG